MKNLQKTLRPTGKLRPKMLYELHICLGVKAHRLGYQFDDLQVKQIRYIRPLGKSPH